MKNNCVKELQANSNFRCANFIYNEQKYEMNVSLYSNTILVFISYNGKISNLYELNIDAHEEKENYFDDGDIDIKDVDIGHCILGKRGNDQMNFFSNFIMSNIKDIIINNNSKITKICLSLSLDNKLLNDFEDNNKDKYFLNEIKYIIGKIFNDSK